MIGSIIGLGVNLISNISEKKRKKREIQNGLNAVYEDRKELDNWYNTASKRDFIDSTATKNSVMALSEEKQKRDEILSNNAVRTGATPEAAIAKAAASNKAYSDSVLQLANLGNNYKSKMDSFYFQNKKDLNDRENKLKNTSVSSKTDYSKILNGIL